MPDSLNLFATPIQFVDLPGIDNAGLAALLVDEEARVPSWKRANVGGWHSAPDLGGRPAFVPLIRAIVDSVGKLVARLAAEERIAMPSFRYGVTAWAMVLRDGHYVSTHDHGDAHWSVAYYVDAGDDAPAPSGRLAMLDPRRGGRGLAELPLFPSTFELTPRTGMLVMFPGWVQHFVHAYRGTRPRICVSCNLVLAPAT